MFLFYHYWLHHVTYQGHYLNFFENSVRIFQNHRRHTYLPLTHNFSLKKCSQDWKDSDRIKIMSQMIAVDLLMDEQSFFHSSSSFELSSKIHFLMRCLSLRHSAGDKHLPYSPEPNLSSVLFILRQQLPQGSHDTHTNTGERREA